MGFEELTRQLLVAAPPAGCARLEHKGVGADGGVEVLAHLTNGSAIGYQTKYHLDVFGAAQIAQIRNSYQAALAAYPQMTGYVVVLPRNLAGGARPQIRSQRALWDRFITEAIETASGLGRVVEITLWDETFLFSRLTQLDPIHAGLRLYWFDHVSLTDDWFTSRFEITKADLSERYLPNDHVDVQIQATLDVPARGPLYLASIVEHHAALCEIGTTLEGAQRVAPELGEPDDWSIMHEGLIELRRASKTVDFTSPEKLDLTALLAAGRTFMESRVVVALSDAWRASKAPDLSEEQTRTRLHYCRKAEAAIERVGRSLNTLDSSLLRKPALLVLGEAGAGKSHALAHLVERHLEKAAPAILLLGQHFGHGEPRGQILDRLGLGHLTFQDFLGAMNAAALATGRPGLLIIDAVNEAHAPQVWASTLAGLAVEIGRFEALALIVSCREVYAPMCIPTGWDVTRAYHHGFAGDEGAAAKAYLDRHGIDRPAAPFLDPSFTNPLLLSTCVRRLVAEGRKAFPLGIDGVSQLFDFWLDGVEGNLVQRGYGRIARGDGGLKRALGRLADEMALDRCEALPLAKAQAVLEREVSTIAPATAEDYLLRRLLAEGVLRRDPAFGDQGETINFTFQRFSDHLIAQAILRLFDQAATLAVALKADGDLGYLLGKDWRRHAGVIEALMVQAPERLGVELIDLEANFANDVKLSVESFLQSLLWRGGDATNSRTVEIFEICWAAEPDAQHRFLTTLLRLASRPGHALNATYLHGHLVAMSMPQRDAKLAGFFYDALHEDGAADVLIDWALSARTELAEPERVGLVAKMLGWFLSAPYRPLRDRATKALGALFLKSPHQMAPIIEAFMVVDDAYVRERILAAAYGAATHMPADNPSVRAAARAAYDGVFKTSPVERHAYVRHYARGLVELAVSAGSINGLHPARAKPPYSTEPIQIWPSIEDLRAHQEAASTILWSTVGHLPASGTTDMAGDFGRYIMGSIGRDFTLARMIDGDPEPIGAVKQRFWDAVDAAGGDLPALAQRARETHAAIATRRAEKTWAYFQTLKAGEEEEGEDDDEEVERIKDNSILSAAIAAQQALRAALPAYLALEDDQEIGFPHHGDRSHRRFPLDLGQRWVANRVLELGWSPTLHGRIEREAGRFEGRNEHASERIGKKYQWIAFHELIGYLADHHWYVGYDERPSALMTVVDFHDVDLDPSYFPPDPSLAPQGLPVLALPRTNHAAPASLAAAKAWVNSLADLPSPADFVEGRGSDGSRWWWLGGGGDDTGYHDKLSCEGLMQTGTRDIEFIVLPTQDAPRLHNLLTGFKKPDNDADDEGWPTPRLFGEFRAALTPEDDLVLHRAVGAIRYGRLTHGYQPHRGEYDFAGHDEGGFATPRRWLLRALHLRPAGPHQPWFIDDCGRTALHTPSRVGQSGGAMINADLLEPVLRARGLTAAWLVWAEKDGGVGAGPHYRPRNDLFRAVFGGMWWRDDSVWRGSNWLAERELKRPWVTD